MRRTAFASVILTVVLAGPLCTAAERRISREQLLDKISGFWIGQLAGNYMGFPFENVYEAEPCPFLVDRYYTWRDDESIRMNRDDLRGYVPILAGAFEGAFSDDECSKGASLSSTTVRSASPRRSLKRRRVFSDYCAVWVSSV